MAITPSYITGVKYIKIAKTDASGSDNTIYLQNLDKIRILFSDIPNAVSYPIISINEYPSYYLYTISTTNITSSADQEILNYKVSASSNTLSGGGGGQFISYSVNTNPINYFTASNGLYTAYNTPNVIIQITGSATINYSGYINDPTQFILYTAPNISSPFDILSSINLPSPSGTYTVTISGSFTLVEGTSFFFYIEPGDNGVISANLQFKVTQSVTPQSSNNDIIVLEPYIDGVFNNSDCNVLQNNVITNQTNEFYMNVDYTSGSIIAENQASILNGSAARSQVQSWNYTYDSHIGGRYVGKEQQALSINTYSKPGNYTTTPFGFSGSWPGDTTSPGINGSVVIEQLDSCIYEMSWAGGGYPENSKGGKLEISNILLVGSNKDDVAIIPPNNPLYYDILNKNIPGFSQITIKPYNSTTTSTLNATAIYPALQINDAAYWIYSSFNINEVSTLPLHSILGYVYPTGSGSIAKPFIELTGVTGSLLTRMPTAIRLNDTQQAGPLIFTIDACYAISSSILSGSRWFASLYQGLGPTSSPSQSGLPENTEGLGPIYQIGPPFEIKSVENTISGSDSKYKFYISPPDNSANIASYFTSSDLAGAIIGLQRPLGDILGYGLILTTGTKTTQITSYIPSITLQDTWRQFSGLGAGCITTQYPTQTIVQNIDYITKKYGNNPNP